MLRLWWSFYRFLTCYQYQWNSWPFPADGSAGRAALMTIGFSKSFGIAQATPCYEVVRRLTLPRKTTGLGRPVSFSGNCVRGAQWARIGPFDWGQGWLVSPVSRRVWNLRRGIRRRGGLRRRQLVQSILPSGLLKVIAREAGRLGEQLRTRKFKSIGESPMGLTGGPDRGSHR